jgi:hypothetical protein
MPDLKVISVDDESAPLRFDSGDLRPLWFGAVSVQEYCHCKKRFFTHLFKDQEVCGY